MAQLRVAFVPATSDAPLKYVEVNASALGDTTIIAAVPGKTLRIIGYHLSNVLALVVRLKSTGGGFHAGFELGANGRASYAGSLLGPAFETAVGEGLVLNASVATGVRGHITYQEV